MKQCVCLRAHAFCTKRKSACMHVCVGGGRKTAAQSKHFTKTNPRTHHPPLSEQPSCSGFERWAVENVGSWLPHDPATSKTHHQKIVKWCSGHRTHSATRKLPKENRHYWDILSRFNLVHWSTRRQLYNPEMRLRCMREARPILARK